jgi:hypothetical protein
VSGSRRLTPGRRAGWILATLPPADGALTRITLSCCVPPGSGHALRDWLQKQSKGPSPTIVRGAALVKAIDRQRLYAVATRKLDPIPPLRDWLFAEAAAAALIRHVGSRYVPPLLAARLRSEIELLDRIARLGSAAVGPILYDSSQG